jgi:hypothetical protein
MATVPVGNTELVDLYANKGSADPLLIACALDAIRQDADLLVAPIWVVVSNDKAVRATAEQLGVDTRTRAQFFDETRTQWTADLAALDYSCLVLGVMPPGRSDPASRPHHCTPSLQRDRTNHQDQDPRVCESRVPDGYESKPPAIPDRLAE